MWTREGIKSYAKDFLRKHYLKAFIVCLIATLLTGSGSSGNTDNINDINNPEYNNQNQIIDEVGYQENLVINNSVNRFTTNRLIRSPIYYLVGSSIAMFFIILLVILVTIGYALEVGKVRFFLRGFKDDVRIGNLFSTFNLKEYFRIVKTQFLRGLYTVFWTILFIIPGIIKGYEYSMVPYILSENSDLSGNEAITMSRNITQGHKMDMFILDLSFIGWYFLGFLFFGIGGIFVNPYKEATIARLYNILSRNDNIDTNIIDEDLVLE